MDTITGISPMQFVHILDLNTNVTRVEVGPKALVLQTNERLIAGPLPLIVIPPAHYVKINNPMSNYVHGKVCELKLGQSSYRFHGEPFHLYPGETLDGAEKFGQGSADYSSAVKKQMVIPANQAVRLVAILDHEDEDGSERQAGDLWQLEGPLMYYPTPDAEVKSIIKPTVIKDGQTLRLRAIQGCTDSTGNERVTGEEWYISTPGAYLPGVCEEIVTLESKTTLTVDKGLHLRAVETHVDNRGITRLAGEEWLLTGEEQDEYYPEIGVEIVSTVKKATVKLGQHCVIQDPVDKSGRPQFGKLELRKGLCSFFLHPSEKIVGGIQNNFVLAEDESIVLQATEEFTEIVEATGKGKATKRTRKCGERWMICGPVEYIPPIEVKVQLRRKQIPLSKNEGIYVQDTQTGKVRAEMGQQSYMLKAYEQLWEKELSPMTEEMLKQGGGAGSGDIRKMAYFEQSVDPAILKGREKTHVVTYRCPGNTAVQINNYLDKTARVVFGPDLVILGPHENFNILSLSAGKPKKSDAMKSLCLMLGPDFITDIIEVETADHARLRLQIAFNNHFEYEKGNYESETKLFSVPDFIGFASRQIGSKIRAAVALVMFDDFHKHSAQVIKHAVFMDPKTGELGTELRFSVNNLVITSIDVQSIEPVDRKMNDSLSKSIQLAIEIATSSIEAAARHEAIRTEQVAKGHLERQKLANEKDAERERCKLMELRSIAAAVESTGQAKAEAQAQAERILIECESEIEGARLRTQAAEIEHYAKLETQDMLRQGELDYQRSQNTLETEKDRTMANIEVNKFSRMVKALGRDTIAAIAMAGPQKQVEMLKALGLESTLFTDGNSPINLFNTAEGLVQTSKAS